MRTALLAAAMALASIPAFANNFATNSPGVAQALGAGAPAAASNAHATAAAASASRSRSSATGGTGGAGGTASVVNNNTGGGGGYGGAAQSFSPPGIATTNNCGGGFSIGGFGVGAGGGGGALWELHDCRLRQAAVLLDQRGDHAAAKNVWCQISEVRLAYKQAGEPCPDDNSGTVQPINVAAQAAPSAEYPFDYCYTSNAGELRQHKECVRSVPGEKR